MKTISNIQQFYYPILRWLSPHVHWLHTMLLKPQAVKLNQNLYRDVKQIDPSYLGQVRQQLRSLALEKGISPEKADNWVVHAQRLILSQKWLEEILSTLSGNVRALDLGPPSIASDFLRSVFPDLQWQNTNWDLRYSWDVSNGTIDLIICTELIEHISDPPNENFNEGFYQVGFQALLEESFRVLSPGGYFFGTTPNAASVCHLEAVVKGNPPWLNQKHIREYTQNEIHYHLQQAGFEIIRSDDVHCISIHEWKDYTSLFIMLLINDLTVEGRGDDLFFVVKKPQE